MSLIEPNELGQSIGSVHELSGIQITVSWKVSRRSSPGGSLISSPGWNQYRIPPKAPADQFCDTAVATAPKTLCTNIPGSFRQECQSPFRLSGWQRRVLVRPAQEEVLAGSVRRQIRSGASA